MIPVLEIRKPVMAQSRISLSERELWIGRISDRRNDVVVAAEGVSRIQHFSLTWDPAEKKVRIRDRHSTGGTYVFPRDDEAERIDLRDTETLVSPGARIAFGEARAVIAWPQQTDNQAPPPKSKWSGLLTPKNLIVTTACLIALVLALFVLFGKGGDGENRRKKITMTNELNKVIELTTFPLSAEFNATRQALTPGSEASELANYIHMLDQTKRDWQAKCEEFDKSVVMLAENIMEKPFVEDGYMNMLQAVEIFAALSQKCNATQTKDRLALASLMEKIWSESPPLHALPSRTTFSETIAKIADVTDLRQHDEACLNKGKNLNDLCAGLQRWAQGGHGCFGDELRGGFDSFSRLNLTSTTTEKWRKTASLLSQWDEFIISIKKLEEEIPTLIKIPEKRPMPSALAPCPDEPSLGAARASWSNREAFLQEIRPILVSLAETTPMSFLEWQYLGELVTISAKYPETASAVSKTVQAVGLRKADIRKGLMVYAQEWLRGKIPGDVTDWPASEAVLNWLKQSPDAALVAGAKPDNYLEWREAHDVAVSALRRFCEDKYALWQIDKSDGTRLKAICDAAALVLVKQKWPEQINRQITDSNVDKK